MRKHQRPDAWEGPTMPSYQLGGGFAAGPTEATCIAPAYQGRPFCDSQDYQLPPYLQPIGPVPAPLDAGARGSAQVLDGAKPGSREEKRAAAAARAAAKRAEVVRKLVARHHAEAGELAATQALAASQLAAKLGAEANALATHQAMVARRLAEKHDAATTALSRAHQVVAEKLAARHAREARRVAPRAARGSAPPPVGAPLAAVPPARGDRMATVSLRAFPRASANAEVTTPPSRNLAWIALQLALVVFVVGAFALLTHLLDVISVG